MAGKKKSGGDDEGAPGWIVTFSDLMSLLLTFFVLLLSFSTISEEDFEEAMMSLQGAFGILNKYNGMINPVPRPPKKAKAEIVDSARRIRRQLQVLGKEKQVKVEFDAKGGIKISLPSSVLFDAGSATLRPGSLPVLRNVAEVLADMPDTFVEVHGHTDGTPVSRNVSYRDNYDLSYFRADAVTRQLQQLGQIPMDQFEIVACGPSQPLAPNTTAEGRVANRRVEIFVRGLVKKDRIEFLFDEAEENGAQPLPDYVPISPRELNELR